MASQLENGLVVSSIVEVSMNSTVNSVGIDDWTAKLAIIASNEIS